MLVILCNIDKKMWKRVFTHSVQKSNSGSAAVVANDLVYYPSTSTAAGHNASFRQSSGLTSAHKWESTSELTTIEENVRSDDVKSPERLQRGHRSQNYALVL